MRWWPFGKCVTQEDKEEIENGHKLKDAEIRLKEANRKLAQTKAKAPEIARAAASARRVNYKVDKFTEEIGRAFGRLSG
jgi:phage terminase Nu1 subunit (DNA packaging protein)